MLQLKPRVDFGGIPFPSPVSEFSLQWLSQTFLPSQRKRRDTVISTVTTATARIEAARAQAAKGLPVMGEQRKDGSVLQQPYHLEMQRMAKTVADRQVADVARNIRLEVDAAVVPVLKDMRRASLTAGVLQDRVFDRLSCLARINAGMNNAAEMAFRANCAALVTGAEPVVLYRMAQAAIDRAAPEDFILIHAILCENIKHPKDRRAFPNTELLALVNPPEFTAAAPLLAAVLDLEKEASISYTQLSGLSGHMARVGQMRIARGLAEVRLAADGLPASGTDDAV